MKNKVQGLKKSMNHLINHNLCYTRLIINIPYSVYWSYGDSSNKFNVTLYDEGGYRSARVGVDIEGRWAIHYGNNRGREKMEIFGAELTEEEDIILDSYFEDPSNPTDEEASLFCLLFANLSGFLVEVSNRILEEEANCGE